MTISADKLFPATRLQIIERAVSLLNIYGVDADIDAKNYERCSDFLNMMLKNWSALTNHLWEKKTISLFTQAYQNTYTISLTSSDHCTLEYYHTTLSVDALAGATSIEVTSVANIVAGDYIGILMDNNYRYWTKILLIVGTIVYFDGGVLTYTASSGAHVYNYTTKIETPLTIYSAIRRDDNDIDIKMGYLSYQEYFNIPNKESYTDTPTTYNYDRQLDNATIKLWPTPNIANHIIRLSIGRKISNLTYNTDTLDFPDEWQKPIVYGLAVDIAPLWGKNKGEGFNNLVATAKESYNLAANFDSELGTVYFLPDLK